MTYRYFMEVGGICIGSVSFLAPLTLEQKRSAERLLAEKRVIKEVQLIPYGDFPVQKSMAFVMLKERMAA